MRPLIASAGGVLLSLAGLVLLPAPQARAYVALMAGQTARPLQGQFNNVPVLHSNQPEEVLGPGILVNTMPGSAIAVETNQPLANATYTFNGEFGLHVHHKYNPQDRSRLAGAGGRRGELTLATILINPSSRPVHLRFQTGAVRNSFEAPYLANNLMGVKPLGPRPWNTGPGDATAVQMLRQQLDRRLTDEITIPAQSRIVLFSTALPAKGIANALLRGRSDGPFQMAVVAAEDPNSDADLLAVLDAGRLAPGRIYLSRIQQIENGTVFSRVAGVALGDTYQATIEHDLNQSPLHVPLTSTSRHNFGTGEVQVNQLASRMLDSSVNNVGTYGVRFDVLLNLRGSGPYQLVLSHPTPNGRNFTAFRGSIAIASSDGLREVHVGLRSGESLPLADLNLKPGQPNLVKVSLVYPADATPGHLLSVVPEQQMAQWRQRELMVAEARRSSAKAAGKPELPPLADGDAAAQLPLAPPNREIAAATAPSRPSGFALHQPASAAGASPAMPKLPAVVQPTRMSQSLIDRYQEAVEIQRQFIKSLMGR